jgi:hypothetical protein
MNQEEKDILYRNLVIFLRMFKNRPHHLAKYFIDNESFNQIFIKKVLESNKLKKMIEEEDDLNSKLDMVPIYFSDINQMNDFYNSIINDTNTKLKSLEELTKEINTKLDDCIKNENYEDAVYIRDYMNRNGIKRTNNF